MQISVLIEQSKHLKSMLNVSVGNWIEIERGSMNTKRLCVVRNAQKIILLVYSFIIVIEL